MNSKYNIAGETFGYLTVIGRDISSVGERNSKWICLCKCGKETIATRSSLITGHTTSCGCKAFESRNSTHGMSKTRIYSIWNGMKTRCHAKRGTNAHLYANKGITVCPEWENDFVAFFDWAMANGYADNLTIDRIDNGKGYSPDNCRWITIEEQQSNKTTNVLVEYKGKKYCLRQLCLEIGFPYKTAHRRYMRAKAKGHPILAEKLVEPIHGEKISKRYRKP